MKKSGFTLIQLSIILTVASLVFVATLPGVQTSLKANATSVTRMNAILNTMRGYMAANGYLPCPADPLQATQAGNYGVAAANPGTGSPGNCIGGTPAAAYADTTNHIAIGMVPVTTLGLSYADAVDGYGRDITYAVDTNATSCWPSSSLTGAITVNDNGTNFNTVAALISHGADGYGAWLPLSGTSGAAPRFDNGSTDTSQAANAQVATGGGLTPNTTFVSFVKKAATSTFDDNVVYKSNLYTLNNLPTAAWAAYASVTPPANGTYSTGNVLTFTLTYASTVTVNTANGTPRLDLSALGTGSIGTGNKAYATYQSGSGTTTLTFSYTVQSTDSAPTSGLTMTAGIDLNGGTVSGATSCFIAPNLSGVLIGGGPPYYRTVTIDHTKVGMVNNTDQTNFPILFSGTYSYLATQANGGQVTNANGYDITFTSDAAGAHLLPFERESYNATTGAVNFWVQVPTVSHTTDTVIYLQYANSSITTDQSNAHGTWDSNYIGVWHLDETSGTTNADSTSNGNSATKYSSSSPNPTTAGQIGGAQLFDGTTSYESVTNTSVDITGNRTIEAWVNPASFSSQSGSRRIINDYKDANNGYQVVTWFSGTGFLFTVNDSGTQYEAATGNSGGCTTTYNTGTWYHVVGTYLASSHTITLYINGAPFTTTCSAGVFSFGGSHLYFGTMNITATLLSGTLDEARVSNIARSADWVKTEYNSESAPDKATYGSSGFYTVGSQTAR